MIPHQDIQVVTCGVLQYGEPKKTKKSARKSEFEVECGETVVEKRLERTGL